MSGELSQRIAETAGFDIHSQLMENCPFKESCAYEASCVSYRDDELTRGIALVVEIACAAHCSNSTHLMVGQALNRAMKVYEGIHEIPR